MAHRQEVRSGRELETGAARPGASGGALDVDWAVRSRVLIGVFLLALILAWYTRGMGFSSRGTPSAVETTVMRAARRWGTPLSARDRPNPADTSDAVLRGAMEHWADHCAGCHGNDGRGHTEMGHGLYPKSPDMRAAATQSLTDGELFYIIEHGVPLTGMPAWGNGTPQGEMASWALVRFIRRLPALTEDDLAIMQKLNPKSALQIEQDKQIDDFLNGKDVK
jgi:mono/diheme cytochrome c family protein